LPDSLRMVLRQSIVGTTQPRCGFHPLANQGDDVAQFDLGLLYNKGWGVPRDYVQAVRWYRRAADQGNADAQYNLGLLYDKAHRYAEAMHWYRKAADQALADAQYNLGILYAKGHGVPQGYAEAMKWFRLAADQDLADAQYYLGILYAKGQGADFVQAYKWLDLSGGAGQQRCQKNRDTIAERMTPEQIAEAQKLAREWKPKPER
jgi:uncharacterized protein